MAEIWVTDDAEFQAKYPHYLETGARLEAVLQLAQLQGVTPQELVGLTASLHARYLAELQPTDQQLEQAIELFRKTVIANKSDLN